MPERRMRRVPMPKPATKPGDGHVVKCRFCDLEWGDKATIDLGAIQLHFDTSDDHPADIHFDLVWRGEGPEPPKPVVNREMRRRQARKGKG